MVIYASIYKRFYIIFIENLINITSQNNSRQKSYSNVEFIKQFSLQLSSKLVPHCERLFEFYLFCSPLDMVGEGLKCGAGHAQVSGGHPVYSDIAVAMLPLHIPEELIQLGKHWETLGLELITFRNLFKVHPLHTHKWFPFLP